MDSWLIYSWFDNEVHGQDLEKEKYSSKGMTASIEGGYAFKADNDLEKKSFYIQPKAQVIYMGVKTDDYTETNGTTIEFIGAGNVQTRLGVRLYSSDLNKAEVSQKIFQPFAEVNWIHNQKNFGIKMNETNDEQVDVKDLGEFKLGTEMRLSPNFDAWGNISHQWGKNKYANIYFVLGLKYSF